MSKLTDSVDSTADNCDNKSIHELPHLHSTDTDLDVVPPIDATTTLSEAGQVAAKVDSELVRPGVVPQTLASQC